MLRTITILLFVLTLFSGCSTTHKEIDQGPYRNLNSSEATLEIQGKTTEFTTFASVSKCDNVIKPLNRSLKKKQYVIINQSKERFQK